MNPRAVLFLFCLACLSNSSLAQNNWRKYENDRVLIQGGSNRFARQESDIGRSDASRPMLGMSLVLAPAPRRYAVGPRVPESGMLLDDWLQSGPRGYPDSDEQLQTAISWLRAHGLMEDPVLGSSYEIRFRGTVAQVEEAFRTEIHDYLIEGRTYRANASDLSIPRTLSKLVRRVILQDALPSLSQGATTADGFRLQVLHRFSGGIVCLPAAATYLPCEGLSGGVVMDGSGNLYGTRNWGGSTGYGIVFKIDTLGHETVLHNFTGTDGDGTYPSPGLIIDGSANLYGTTVSGGTGCLPDGCGIVFKVSPTGNESVLYSFTGEANSDGESPNGRLVLDSNGNLYGTTLLGGPFGCGTVFKVDPTGHESLLYVFSATSAGLFPNGGLAIDQAGNLYGTTPDNGDGRSPANLFRIDANGNLSVLYVFMFGDGPNGGLVTDNRGNIYGTTATGGLFRQGSVFKLDNTGNLTLLYSFTGTNGDGYFVTGGLALDSSGNLYGTTYLGGNQNDACRYYPLSGGSGCGTVFKVDPAGNEKVLYSFTAANGDGGHPQGGLVMDSSGSLYSTTSIGSTGPRGMVFKLDAAGHETVLYNFKNEDGADPGGGLVMDNEGKLYGAASGGSSDLGAIFQVDPSGNESVLYSFADANSEGSLPNGGLVLDSTGNLYGTTGSGGSGCQPTGCGTVFKVDATGHESVLYNFEGAASSDGNGSKNGLGNGSNDGVALYDSGNLYGTTGSGGSGCQPNGCGTVFKVDPSGHESVIYSFAGTASEGPGLNGGLVLDSNGNLYGTTVGGGTSGCGTVFKLDPAGHESIVYSFQCGVDGSFPEGGLVMDSFGNLYGATGSGGIDCGPVGCGTVFKVDPAGNETVLYSFLDPPDGQHPTGGLVMDSFGNLYGATGSGGTCPRSLGCGIVFRVDPTGHETILHSFQGGTDGSLPWGNSLVLDNFGNIYGTTALNADLGSVFQLWAPLSLARSLAFNPFAGTSTEQNLSLSNNGTATLMISDLTISGTNASDFSQTTNCSPSVAVGATCQINITFTPSGWGTRNANIWITDNAVDSPQGVALSGAGIDFSLDAASSGSTSASVDAGQSATFDLRLNPFGGFVGSVSLACTGAPSKSSCSVTPAVLNISGSSAEPFSVVVTTTGQTAAARNLTGALLSRWPPLVCALLYVLAVLLVLLLSTSRWNRKSGWAISFVIVVLLIATACGSSNSNKVNGTPPGTYALTVTGTQQGMNRALKLTLYVN